MGIYDREYIRVGPRSSSGLGSLRFISFNSWIIIINVLVFVIDILTASFPVPVVISESFNRPVDKDFAKNAVTDGIRRDVTGAPLPDQVTGLFRDRTGAVVQRTIPNPALQTGGSYYLVVVDRRSPNEIAATRRYILMPPLQAYGHLSTYYGIQRVEMWRYITFQFLHASISHIFFNMFGLWIFGGMVEQYLGSRRYAAFYLTCGIFGAISYLLLNLLGLSLGRGIPGLLTDSVHTPLVGASAGVFGVIMAAAYIAPNAIVQLLFPPIPLKLKWFAYGYVALAAANLLRGGQNAGGDAAHVGGALAGYFFVRNAHLLRDFFDVIGRRAPSGGGKGDNQELDRILQKVAHDGLSSLTESEKRTLRRASERRT